MIRVIDHFQIRAKIKAFIDDGMGTPSPERVRFIEIGPFESFERLHIPGAIHLHSGGAQADWVAEVNSHIQNRATEIILYEGVLADHAQLQKVAETLNEAGYGEIYIYPGGKQDWVSHGLWTETAWVPADEAGLKRVS